jgi:hypothetical protein
VASKTKKTRRSGFIWEYFPQAGRVDSMKTPHKLSVALCTSKKESVAFVAFALSGEDGTARSSSNTAAETKARSAL